MTRDVVVRWMRGMVAALVVAAPIALQAQDHPNKPVRVVVPLSPGGSTDAVVRMLVPKLAEALGQPVVIENRPGAGGNLGADVVAKSAPDGYTLLIGTSTSHGVNPSLYANMPYDAARDFAPITLIGHVPFILMANPGLGVHSRGSAPGARPALRRALSGASVLRATQRSTAHGNLRGLMAIWEAT